MLDMHGWDAVHQAIKDFVDYSGHTDDIDEGGIINSKEDKLEWSSETGSNFEQDFEGGLDVILKNDPTSSHEARTLFSQSESTPFTPEGTALPWTPGISKENEHKKLNLQEALDLKSEITKHLNRAIEFPQAYDLELRKEDKDTYGRILNSDSAERVKWAVWKKINEKLPYMISKQQFTKIVGNLGNGALLQNVIGKEIKKYLVN